MGLLEMSQAVLIVAVCDGSVEDIDDIKLRDTAGHCGRAEQGFVCSCI